MFCTSVVLASCALIMDDANTPTHNGEIETSYIAINLMAADPDTRAEGAVYQDGLSAERAVSTAYFFFFQNGQPFPVTVTDNTASAPGTGANYLSASLSGSTTVTPNVSDVKNVVLLLKNYRGQYPNQIVAVLNWVPVAGKSYTMDELKDVVDVQSTISEQKYLVMSNAVYADAVAQTVTATPLTVENIYTTQAAAMADPIEIYVERAAAKVTVTAPAEKTFDLSRTIVADGSSVKAYAKVIGWELYNDFSQSHLLKKINPAWTVDAVGFNWNDMSFHRSYWAISPEPDWGEGNTFTWNDGHVFGLLSDVNNGTYASNSYVYCGENTTDEADNRTKVIVKARLVDASGVTIELARWYGSEYLTEKNLRTVVATTLKNTYFYKDGTSYKGIVPEDLKCVVGGGTGAPTGVDATEVYFQLSDAGEEKAWFEYSSANGYQSLEEAELNVKLATVPPAVLYKNGQTYYFLDIKHLGATGKLAEYGIVRNHVYSVNINSIKGYGSPVYDPASKIEIPQYPEEPSNEGSFVSAQVNILSWRMVSQGVDIVQ